MNSVTIYTDGACSGNPGPGGYGAILICNGKEREISGGEPETTNNRMEIRAVIESLKKLKHPCDVEVYSDSSYVVNTFLQGWITSWQKKNWHNSSGDSVKNQDLWQELYDLTQYHHVSWIKVKGHSDNEYNNRCDKLATDYIKTNYKQIKKEPRDIAEVYTGEVSEKILENKMIYQGNIFAVEKLTVETADSQRSAREIVRHNGGAAVVAMDDDQNIYMVRQYRVALAKEMLEIPAGKLDKGEDPYECAKRELMEETGLIAEKLELMLEMHSAPGFCDETIYIYFAEGLKQGKPHYDVDEFIVCERYHIKELVKMIDSGELTDGKTIVGILTANRKIFE